MSCLSKRSERSESWSAKAHFAFQQFIDSRLQGAIDPRRFGKALRASWKRYWSYRVGDYRLICELQDDRVVIIVIEIGHRSDIYR